MADRYCFTDVKIEKISFLWVVRHFELSADDNKPLESPPFSGSASPMAVSASLGRPKAVSTKTLQWVLRLKCSDLADNVSLKLALVSDTEKGRTIKTTFKFAILDRNGEEKYAKQKPVASFTESLRHTVYDIRHTLGRLEPGANLEAGFDNFIKKSKLLIKEDDLLPNGTLKIHCTLDVKGEVVHTAVLSKDCYVPSCDLGIQLGSALHEDPFADFTLVVGDKELKAHKVVLAVRSPVFKRMIESPMQENRENRVEITDFDPKVVQELLTYIYTGEAPNLKKMPQELLKIAEKYELQRLKFICGSELNKCLREANAIDTLILADTQNQERLKKSCIDFIVNHLADVAKTPGWDALKTENNCLYIAVLETQNSCLLPPAAKKPRYNQSL